MAESKAGALSAVQAWIDAVNRHDPGGTTAAFASDASFFGTTTKALVTSSEGIQQYFEEVFAKYAPLSVELGRVNVTELSPESAVVSGYDQWKVTVNGKSVETFGRLSIAVSLREGQWRMVSFHRSTMPD